MIVLEQDVAVVLHDQSCCAVVTPENDDLRLALFGQTDAQGCMAFDRENLRRTVRTRRRLVP